MARLTFVLDDFAVALIHGNKIKDKSLHGNKIQDGSINASKIQDKTITNNDIADNANIHGNKLKDKSVHGNKIQDGSISASKLAPGLLDGKIQINGMKSVANVKVINSDYTVTNSDAGVVLEIQVSEDINITLPQNLTKVMILEVNNLSDYNVTFLGQNTDLESFQNQNILSKKFGTVKLRYRGNNKWFLSGNLN